MGKLLTVSVVYLRSKISRREDLPYLGMKGWVLKHGTGFLH